MIIYPPLIENTIPAFTNDKVVITFSQNPAVAWGEVKYLGLVIKKYNNSTIITNLYIPASSVEYDTNTKIGKATFVFGEWKPITKEYYKFQLSYSDDTTINDNSFGAYSVAAIGRCIGVKPNIYIIGARNEMMESQPNLNVATKKFIGTYVTSINSEPLYSYRIYVRSVKDNTIIQDSGTILHNSDEDMVDSTRTSTHEFILNYELERHQQYIICYEITTVNGFTDRVEYNIIKEGRLPIPFEGDLYVGQDEIAYDNGYVQIVLLGPSCKGEFVLERTEDGKNWVTLTTFSLTNLSNLGKVDHNNKIIDLGDYVWKDWSVEQGVNYTYAISQYADNEYSERRQAKPYMADFEHMFLSDGKRQLKIAFNPKVSSFKETILEQKTDTIGSKYPFFFRNGHVRYKEIPISGLLSYHLDDDELFMTLDSLNLIDTNIHREITPAQDNFDVTIPTTNLIGYNFSAERKFKLSVLEWLNNGEQKLFRSPAEGNYVVRLMNTSLSPNDTLGRLLHTFTSTGYETDSADIANLIDKNLVNIPALQDTPPSKIVKTIQFSDIQDWDCNSGTGYRVLWNSKSNGDADLSKPKLDPPPVRGTIQNIQWYSAKPNLQDTIYINDHDGESDAQTVRNLTGVFSTPPSITYDSIIINKPSSKNKENYASTLTFEYMPDLTAMQGTDTFLQMISESADLIFSSPAGTTLRGDNAILAVLNSNNEPIADTYENIYKTYVLIARKDENYKDDNKCQLYFYDYNDRNNPNKYQVIDCSDGQIRYYYDINSNIMYDKTKGLHLDIYARLGGTREALSNRLGQFVLGSSRLGTI